MHMQARPRRSPAGSQLTRQPNAPLAGRDPNELPASSGPSCGYAVPTCGSPSDPGSTCPASTNCCSLAPDTGIAGMAIPSGPTPHDIVPAMETIAIRSIAGVSLALSLAFGSWIGSRLTLETADQVDVVLARRIDP